jgi:hypothetical protein
MNIALLLLAAAASPSVPDEAVAGTMSSVVFLLSAGTSCLCAVLLLRGYTQSRARLLFWSGLCFAGLAIDNTLLYVDVLVGTDINVAVWARLTALIAMMLLVYGLVWDSR